MKNLFVFFLFFSCVICLTRMELTKASDPVILKILQFCVRHIAKINKDDVRVCYQLDQNKYVFNFKIKNDDRNFLFFDLDVPQEDRSEVLSAYALQLLALHDEEENFEVYESTTKRYGVISFDR